MGRMGVAKTVHGFPAGRSRESQGTHGTACLVLEPTLADGRLRGVRSYSRGREEAVVTRARVPQLCCPRPSGAIRDFHVTDGRGWLPRGATGDTWVTNGESSGRPGLPSVCQRAPPGSAEGMWMRQEVGHGVEHLQPDVHGGIPDVGDGQGHARHGGPDEVVGRPGATGSPSLEQGKV